VETHHKLESVIDCDDDDSLSLGDGSLIKFCVGKDIYNKVSKREMRNKRI
jgi:hypothetical protein